MVSYQEKIDLLDIKVEENENDFFQKFKTTFRQKLIIFFLFLSFAIFLSFYFGLFLLILGFVSLYFLYDSWNLCTFNCPRKYNLFIIGFIIFSGIYLIL